ncbi:MAG TPA: hypothetical protein VJI70_02170 [Candidatus Paceibacterota bacterium]
MAKTKTKRPQRIPTLGSLVLTPAQERERRRKIQKWYQWMMKEVVPNLLPIELQPDSYYESITDKHYASLKKRQDRR